MLLPHGYEGQGPEHSSARPERYLQLCAQHNMQVCVPSTPAQIFHLLRRQMLRNYRKPLIVMSPKSLLRHKEAVSSIEELANGQFHTVIGEIDKLDPKKVRRVIVCSGKVYYELLAYRARAQDRRHGDPAPRAAVSVPARGLQERGRHGTRRRRKSSGARRSRRTRARGIGCARCCAPTSTRRRCSPMPAGPCRRRRRVGYAAKHPRRAEDADRGRASPTSCEAARWSSRADGISDGRTRT